MAALTAEEAAGAGNSATRGKCQWSSVDLRPPPLPRQQPATTTLQTYSVFHKTFLMYLDIGCWPYEALVFNLQFGITETCC